ncbi:hypothetical protein [Micromonospora carbonacea]|uniref:Uncharacterized protein n=1 Tax=Micromonospora carbonacea TaxID=47853 RepID=A0A1C5AC80_9ACTN|nr:hypothetical protein [Micromonospora carbonacea]SCF42696.1 hypothetical protein GA0070563_112116 [Micromonospora carbonacea]
MADDRLGGRRSAPRDTTGRVPFVWVEDADTGHRYDVPQTAIRDGMTPVPDYPLNWGRRARPAKYRTDLGGDAAPKGDGTAGEGRGDTPTTDDTASAAEDANAAPTTSTTSTKGGKRS